jgi:hypothetical protein
MSSQGESDKTPGTEKRCEFGKSTRRTFQSRLEMASLSGSASPIGPALGKRPEKGFAMAKTGIERMQREA